VTTPRSRNLATGQSVGEPSVATDYIESAPRGLAERTVWHEAVIWCAASVSEVLVKCVRLNLTEPLRTRCWEAEGGRD